MTSTPLFVCYANCYRSVLAEYIYEDMCQTPAASAGLVAGTRVNETCVAMLRHWDIDARKHRPRQLTHDMCKQAGAIFVVGPPSYLHKLLRDYDWGLADKCYLFADPFTLPTSFADGAYKVTDPTFDQRPLVELARAHEWMFARIARIHLALENGGARLVPASAYLDVVKTIDPEGH